MTSSLWKDVGKYSNFVHNPQLVFFHSNGQNDFNLKLCGKKLITFLWRLKTQSFKIIKHCTSSTSQNYFSSTNIDKKWTTLNWVVQTKKGLAKWKTCFCWLNWIIFVHFSRSGVRNGRWCFKLEWRGCLNCSKRMFGNRGGVWEINNSPGGVF